MAAARANPVQPVLPSEVPNVVEGVTTVAVRRVPSGATMEAYQTGSGTLAPDSAEVEAEREWALAALMTFKKFNPPTFDRQVVDSWVVET